MSEHEEPSTKSRDGECVSCIAPDRRVLDTCSCRHHAPCQGGTKPRKAKQGPFSMRPARLAMEIPVRAWPECWASRPGEQGRCGKSQWRRVRSFSTRSRFNSQNSMNHSARPAATDDAGMDIPCRPLFRALCLGDPSSMPPVGAVLAASTSRPAIRSRRVREHGFL